MRERYRVLRIPRRAEALWEALQQVAAGATTCPDCAALRREADRREVAELLKAVVPPAAALKMWADRCPRCREAGVNRRIIALTFSSGARTRLLAAAQEDSAGLPDHPITLATSDLLTALRCDTDTFRPLVHLLRRLGNRRQAPAVFISGGRVLIRGRDFTPLFRVGNRVAVEKINTRFPHTAEGWLVSPSVALDNWRVSGSHLHGHTPEAERRLVEDLLACTSEEEAERLLTMWALAGDP